MNFIPAEPEKGWPVCVEIQQIPVLTDTDVITQMMNDDKELAQAGISHSMIQEFLDGIETTKQVQITKSFFSV